MQIYDLVDPALLTQTLRMLPEDPSYVLNRFLPDDPNHGIKFSIEELQELNEAATFRAYDAPVALGKPDSFVRRTGQLPPLGRGYLVGEYAELLQQTLAGANTQAIKDAVFGYGRKGVAAIRARMELARGQVLSTGKFTLSGEGGQTLEADFGVPNSNFVNPTVAWTSTSTATVLQDISTWADLAEEVSGVRPAYMLAGKQAIGLALQNENVLNIFGNQFGAPDQIGVAGLNQLLDSRDLPMFAVDDQGKRIRPASVAVDGSTTATFPTGLVSFLPPQGLGRTLWGTTVEALELAADNRLQGVTPEGIVGVAYKSVNPTNVFTLANAIGMPALEKPKALVVAAVTVAD